jgi:hypothetical protein
MQEGPQWPDDLGAFGIKKQAFDTNASTRESD